MMMPLSSGVVLSVYPVACTKGCRVTRMATRDESRDADLERWLKYEYEGRHGWMIDHESFL